MHGFWLSISAYLIDLYFELELVLCHLIMLGDLELHL